MKLQKLIILTVALLLSSNVMAMRGLYETEDGREFLGVMKGCENYLRSTQQYDRADALQYAYFQEQKASGYNSFQQTQEFRKGELTVRFQVKKDQEMARNCQKMADKVTDMIINGYK